MPDEKLVHESTPILHETPEEIAFKLRSHEGALWTGGRLLIGIWAFAFAALAFAYFYLRSGNNDYLWRPNHVTAPTGTGAAIFALTVACAFLVVFGYRRFRPGLGPAGAGGAVFAPPGACPFPGVFWFRPFPRGIGPGWGVAGWTAVLGALI